MDPRKLTPDQCRMLLPLHRKPGWQSIAPDTRTRQVARQLAGKGVITINAYGQAAATWPDGEPIRYPAMYAQEEDNHTTAIFRMDPRTHLLDMVARNGWSSRPRPYHSANTRRLRGETNINCARCSIFWID